jgi:hypothetical protein
VVQEDSYKIYFVIFGHYYKFLRILKICTIFCELKQLKNNLKIAAQCWAESRRVAIVLGPAACHMRPVGRLVGPRPGGPVQP